MQSAESKHHLTAGFGTPIGGETDDDAARSFGNQYTQCVVNIEEFQCRVVGRPVEGLDSYAKVTTPTAPNRN